VPAVLRRHWAASSVLRRRWAARSAGARFAPSAVCFTAALGSAVCFTTTLGGAISQGRTAVEQTVLGLLPVPSVLRRHGTARTDDARFVSQRRLFYGGAAWREQTRPHRRRTDGARFVPQRRLFYGGAGWREQPRPHRRGTAGARFAPSAVCFTAALGSVVCSTAARPLKSGRQGAAEDDIHRMRPQQRPGHRSPTGLPPGAICRGE